MQYQVCIMWDHIGLASDHNSNQTHKLTANMIYRYDFYLVFQYITPVSYNDTARLCLAVTYYSLSNKQDPSTTVYFM